MRSTFFGDTFILDSRCQAVDNIFTRSASIQIKIKKTQSVSEERLNTSKRTAQGKESLRCSRHVMIAVFMAYCNSWNVRDLSTKIYEN